ncbi:MAG: hypothetical protein ACO3EK_12445, partial [Alphaproteobacteria bacterium]
MQDRGAREAPALPAAETAAAPPGDPMVACMLYVLRRLERPLSAAAFRSRVVRPEGEWTLDSVVEALESLGCSTELRSLPADDLDPELGPWIAETSAGPVVVHSSLQDRRVRLFDPSRAQEPMLLEPAQLREELA